MRPPALVVIAKAPVPGRVKTRLCPPCSPWQAASIAEAALRDTLETVAATPASKRVLMLDGEAGSWLPGGFEVHPQVGGGLDARIAGAFDVAGGPALLVGMDTPQLDAQLLAHSLTALARPAARAVLGPAADGGYWAIGLRRPCADAFVGIPMSTPWTARAQRSRLRRLGIRWTELPELRDVDTFADAVEVAKACPASRFADEVRSVATALTATDRATG